MNIPAFTADVSLGNPIVFYSRLEAFDPDIKTIYVPQFGKPDAGVDPKCFYDCYHECMKACIQSPHGGD